jgi:hypothetical protein
MSADQPTSDRLQRLIDRSLRELPLQRAPEELQARVFNRLQLRATWWRQSFANWPLSLRAALVVLCLGCANASVTLWRHLSATQPQQELAQVINPLSWIESLASFIHTLQQFVLLMIQHAPSLWLYAGIISIGSLYVVLVGLSATAYRALYISR